MKLSLREIVRTENIKQLYEFVIPNTYTAVKEKAAEENFTDDEYDMLEDMLWNL